MQTSSIKTVIDYLDISVDRFPEKAAFCDNKRQMTFAELQKEAQKVATVLIQKASVKTPVAIFMDKRPECVAAMCGVLYAGCFYSILDVHMPKARIDRIMEKLEPAFILTERKNQKAAEEIYPQEKILVYEELQEAEADAEAIRKRHAQITSTDIMNVLFTSGSTGNPKGVVIPHSAVIPYLEWLTECFSIDENTVFGNQTPFYFIMSGLDIWQTIKTGATTYIIPKSMFSFPVALLEYVRDNHINTLYWVPSVLCTVANLDALSECHLEELKLVMFGGEVMPTKQLNMWRKEYPDVTFVNAYGPTELTDILTYYTVDRDFADTESLPIGIPCEHMDVLVLDENDRPVAPGEIGELCGRGPSITYGYYSDPEKTAEAFVQNPLNTAYPEKIYRTGDLVRENEYGELIYISRKDFQIKYMGNRIELGEIETAASSIAEIKFLCCLYNEAKKKIVLFYTGDIDKNSVKEQLKGLLPDYMVPARYVQLDEMPMNLNGKVDRAALKELL